MSEAKAQFTFWAALFFGVTVGIGTLSVFLGLAAWGLVVIYLCIRAATEKRLDRIIKLLERSADGPARQVKGKG